MVYEWGKGLPTKGYREEIPDDTVLEVNDIILVTGHMFSSEQPKSEKDVAIEIKNGLEKEGQIPTHVLVTREPIYDPITETIIGYHYEVDYAFGVKKASPITGLEIVIIVVAICAVIGLALFVATPIMWKWAGLTPEEVAKYLEPLGKHIKDVGIIVIIGLAFLFLIIFFLGRKK